MRKVFIFSGNRADYGLQIPIIDSFFSNNNFYCKLIISGAHLEKNFGLTKTMIKNVDKKDIVEIKIKKLKTYLSSTPEVISDAIKKFAFFLKKNRPDFVCVYADRFETFAFVVAASQMNIPIVHCEGGDVTEGGTFDDSIRHAITKLSHLHFTTNEISRQRVLQLGEEKWRVFNIGLSTYEIVEKMQLIEYSELKKRIGLFDNKQILIFTFHSIASQHVSAKFQLKEILRALESILDENIQVIITYPNNDLGGLDLIKELNIFYKKFKSKNIRLIKSLGQTNFYSLMSLNKNKICKITMVGNSSAGIKETPFFGVPTINIGDRQKGRIASSSVINVDCDIKKIDAAIKKIYDLKYLKIVKKTINPYGKYGASNKIVNILKKIKLKNLVKKEFYDLK